MVRFIVITTSMDGICMAKGFNPNCYEKTLFLTGLGVPYKVVKQGIIICEKIVVAKNHSRWKFLGELDWYPYYGLKNLVKALYTDTLIEYAMDQQLRTHRKYNSVPINHEWKDKEKEKEKRAYYRQRKQLGFP